MGGDDVFEVGRKSIYWMIAGFVIAMLMIAFVIIIVGYQERLTAVPAEMKAQFITLRFVTNPDCFAYQDAVTGRVFPYTIDLSKFTQERMEECYRPDIENGFNTLNFKVTIDDGGKSLRTNNYYHVDQSRAGYAVMIWDGKQFVRGSVSIDVQESVSFTQRQSLSKGGTSPTLPELPGGPAPTPGKKGTQ